jgi:[acyl-carrier-protein] S-malonyltransferase
MLKDLAAEFSIVKQTFAEASDKLGFDLWKLVQAGPEADLNRTENTQPAMLAAGVAVWRCWREKGGAAPVYMAGHSLGEYSALVCSGALELADAVELVAQRGRFMQEAVAPGVGLMAAVLGLEDAQVEQVCESAAQGEVVAAVNYNAPGQVVIAGHKPAVERAMDLAKQAGASRCLPLPVSVPSHCALMQPAAERLAVVLANIDFKPPACTVLRNIDAQAHTDPAAIRQALVEQLYRPVRWVTTVNELAAAGVDRVIECGPGKVLTGLNKRINRQLAGAAVFDPASLATALG